MKVKNSDPVFHRGEELTRVGHERCGTFQSSPIEIQSTSDDSNLQGKLKKVRVIEGKII